MKHLNAYWEQLKKIGFTEYDIETKREIYSSFVKFSLITEYRLVLGKELEHHLKDNSLSDDEWQLIIEEKWNKPGISLSDDIN
jgi:hypothetical protein|tara:strand:- start:28791 stop:29039 length:249 start_codon:yes stop_codon:yes gene_type:complete